MNDDWNNLASDERLQKTVDALTKNKFNVIVVNTKEEAKEKFLSLIPRGSEVMLNTSETLRSIGVDNIIDESGEYVSSRKKYLV
jgi:hypothetical protein